MTNDDLDKLAKFTDVAMNCMTAVEVRQNISGNSEIVFETDHKGEKFVHRFLTAAPINISCLIGEVRDLNEFIVKVLMKSAEQDGEPEHGASEVTQMLQAFVDGRKSVVITDNPQDMMGGGASA